MPPLTLKEKVHANVKRLTHRGHIPVEWREVIKSQLQVFYCKDTTQILQGSDSSDSSSMGREGGGAGGKGRRRRHQRHGEDSPSSTACENTRKRKRTTTTAKTRHKKRVQGWLRLLHTHPALVLPMLASGVKGGASCTSKGEFASDELPTVKASLPALDEESLNWLRSTIANLNMRDTANIATWVAGLKCGFRSVSGPEEGDDGNENENKAANKDRKKEKKSHIVVWALRDVDGSGLKLNSVTNTTDIMFNINDQMLLSEPWSQSWPSMYKEFRRSVPRFLDPRSGKATTYRVGQSLMCGIMTQSIISESESLGDVVLRVDPLSSILKSIKDGQWLRALRQTARAADGELGKVIIVLADPHLTDRCEVRRIMDTFGDLANTLDDPSSMRTYPGRQEMEHEQGKFQDMRVLDAIASANGCKWPWRPRTCLGSGECSLEDLDETIYKRSWSTGAACCQRGTRQQLGSLVQCFKATTTTTKMTTPTPTTDTLPNLKHASSLEDRQHPRQEDVVDGADRDSNNKKTDTPSMDPGAYWFHQEIVPELAESEFRVFIMCTGNRGKGGHYLGAPLQRRHGKIIKILHTTAPTNAAGLLAHDAEEYHFSRRGVTRDEVERFALDVFEKLRKLGDKGFESLEVGVRLDVGVHVYAGKGCPFVNEVTRWYCADQFANNGSKQSSTDQLHLTRSFASAFVAWLDSALFSGAGRGPSLRGTRPA